MIERMAATDITATTTTTTKLRLHIQFPFPAAVLSQSTTTTYKSAAAAAMFLVILTLNSCAAYPNQYYSRQFVHQQPEDAPVAVPPQLYYNNYLPELYSEDDSDLVGDYVSGGNNWNVAQQPASPYGTADQLLPDDYYGNNNNENDLESQWAEIEALSNILDMYDQQPEQRQPTWGHIVKDEQEREEPAELELEELKSNKKVGQGVPKIPQPSVKFVEGPVKPTAATAVGGSKGNRNGNGQKEVPLLRPPAALAVAMAPKVQIPPQAQQQQQTHPHAPQSPSANEPVPVIAQRSSDTEKKPSPYDTLRKYLTIEDALKKEAEKRRHEMHMPMSNNRQKKSSNSNIVTDEASLTGQLTNLKKSVT